MQGAQLLARCHPKGLSWVPLQRQIAGTHPMVPNAWPQRGQTPSQGTPEMERHPKSYLLPMDIKTLLCSDSSILSISNWHLLLERHFPIRSGTSKPVQQAALEMSQPRDGSQCSDGTGVVHTSRVAAPLQPFTCCHLTGVIFSEASAVTVIFPVFRKC